MQIILLLFITITTTYASLLDTLSTKEFSGKAAQTVVINTLSDYNSAKRERTFLEKNIRSIASTTGQTAKTARLASEIGESGAHFVVEQTKAIFDKVCVNTESLNDKANVLSDKIKDDIKHVSQLVEVINYNDYYNKFTDVWEKENTLVD